MTPSKKNMSDLEIAMHLFKDFFDKLGLPLAILDRSGTHVYYNEENARLDGYSRKDVLGKHILEVFPEAMKNDKNFLRALETGESFVNEFETYYNAVGRLIHNSHTTIPLFDRDNQIAGAIEVSRDLSTMRALEEQVRSLSERIFLKKAVEELDIVFSSPVMAGLIKKAYLLANAAVPVTLVGETGTGKELFARYIHAHSDRADKPFIALNCAALPTSLIESALFGSVKGAFTGAENRKGYLELADGGFLFLDELASMPLEGQSKLLRFLQEKTFWKVGGSQEQTADVRIITAIHASPFALIRNKELRPDLFYRLDVGLISLPPLRERKEDIPVLTEHFLHKHRDLAKGQVLTVPDRIRKQLLDYHWPGNVRMLESVIMRSLIMHEGREELNELSFNEEFEVERHMPPQPDLPEVNEKLPAPAAWAKAEHPHFPGADNTGFDLSDSLAQFERFYIVLALKRHKGSVATAARDLRMSRGALRNKIKKYGIHLSVIEERG